MKWVRAQDVSAHGLDQRPQQGGGLAHPAGQGRTGQIDPGTCVNLGLPIERQVSGAGESHPRALPEPDMNLSTHPAPIVQSFVSPLPNVETALAPVFEAPSTSPRRG